MRQQQAQDAPLTRGETNPQQGDDLPFLQIMLRDGSDTSRQIAHHKAIGLLRRSRGTGSVRQGSYKLLLLLVFFYIQEGREDRGWHPPQQITQVTEMVGREGAPGEPPQILMRPLQLRKTRQCPSQRIEVQFQGGGLDRVLLVLRLPERGCQDEHRQHVLVG